MSSNEAESLRSSSRICLNAAIARPPCGVKTRIPPSSARRRYFCPSSIRDSAESGPHHRQYGLIAEEVAKVYPDLVQYDKAGKPFTIYYHLLTPMLLNELQREHHHAVEQDRRVATQKSEIVALKAALQAQTAELAALKQAQEQQTRTLARLSAFIQASPHEKTAEKTMLTRR